MMKPRALDLFCSAGGATKGLQMAGYHVSGIDIKSQPRYCGDAFVKADALEILGLYGGTGFGWKSAAFDLIWASPPCQAHTSMKRMHNAKKHVDLIPAVREALKKTGIPYVIENVPGAPLENPTILLCGTMFGLGAGDAELQRHRLFETSFPMLTPECRHGRRKNVIGVYGGHLRNRKRKGQHSGVDGFTIEQGREALGIDWMTLTEMGQSIPPAFADFIGRQALEFLGGTSDDRRTGDDN